MEIIANRLSQLSAIGDRLFPATDSVQSARATARRKVKTSLL